MPTWFTFERRWLLAILQAMLPARPGQLGVDAVDFSQFWPLFQQAATPLLRFGVRAATWFVALSPIFWIGRLKRFDKLSASDQDRVINAAAASDLFLARQMLNTLKIVACFAYFRETKLRAPFERPAA